MSDWTHTDLIEAGRLAFDVLCAIGVVVMGAFVRTLKAALANMVTREELAQHMADHVGTHDELEDRLNEGDVRFTKLETTLAHMPNRKDFDSLIHRLSDIATGIAAVTSKVNELSVQVHQLVKNELEARK